MSSAYRYVLCICRVLTLIFHHYFIRMAIIKLRWNLFHYIIQSGPLNANRFFGYVECWFHNIIPNEDTEAVIDHFHWKFNVQLIWTDIFWLLHYYFFIIFITFDSKQNKALLKCLLRRACSWKKVCVPCLQNIFKYLFSFSSSC